MNPRFTMKLSHFLNSRSVTKFGQKTRKPLFLFISPTSTTSTRNPTTLRALSSPSPCCTPNGPLFLSYPPWKLLLSATPLYDQSNHIIPKLNAPQPIKLGLQDSEIVASCTSNQADLVKTFLNCPNVISITRLVSGPLLGWMIMQGMYFPAFLGLLVSGATDWLDGYVARKMGINSVVGSYLDPLADKVLIGSVVVAMLERGLLHSGLVALVVMRDLALVGGAIYIRVNHIGSKSRSWSEFFNLDGIRPQKVEPLMISKVNTCFQLALVTAALLQPEFGTQETESYITYLGWLVASTTVASTAAYGIKHMRNRSIFIQKNV